MRKRSLAVYLAVFLLAAGPAFPQSPPADAMEAARELVATVKLADQFKAIGPIIMQNLKSAIVQNRPQVERDYDSVMPLLLEGMNSRVNEMVDQITALYARTFNVDELHALTAFFRSPAGQKYVQMIPAITQESMVIGQRFGQSVAKEMQDRVIEELRKRGHKI